MSYTSKDYIYKANRIEQGTGVNTKHYGADDGGGWKFRGDPPFFSKTDSSSTEGQAFAPDKVIKDMIHCCDKLPYMVITDGITQADTSGSNFPIYADCTEQYEYIHSCGCPKVFLWEYHLGGFLQKVYHEADGQSNFNADGSPNSHPAILTSDPVTDSLFGLNGANGYYSRGESSDSSNNNRGEYALRCDNLYSGCSYVVYVLFEMKDSSSDNPTNSGIKFHGGANIHSFTSSGCVHYIGGQADGGHGAGNELKLFKDAQGSNPDDTHVNIKGLHIQMDNVPQGRNQSSISHAQNPAKC
tara:strand:+ start:34921 stop:35817 length:897 start_codon:yes stop_codon:yes gene_type:complete